MEFEVLNDVESVALRATAVIAAAARDAVEQPGASLDIRLGAVCR